MSLVSVLRSQGLSENEANVYLANLELGTASIQDLAQKSLVKRTTIYTTVQGLMEKGLVSKIRKGAKNYFIAEEPGKLERLEDDRKKVLGTSLPELMSIYNLMPQKPRVRFYEGKQGYFNVCQETLDAGVDEVLQIGNLDSLYAIIGKEWDYSYYIPERVKRGFFSRIMIFTSQGYEGYPKKDPTYNREVRFLPEEYKYPAFQFVYGNKVALISSEKELMTLVVESNSLSMMMKANFEWLWQYVAK